MNLVAGFNLFEAVWWIALGVAAIFGVGRPNTSRYRRLLGGVLLLFGISDLIEIRSDAWWRPWWLAVMKIACSIAILSLSLAWWRAAKRGGSNVSR